MKAEIRLRPMTESDLGFADSLRDIAGWNQTVADWKRLLRLSADVPKRAQVSKAARSMTSKPAKDETNVRSRGHPAEAGLDNGATSVGCFLAEWRGFPAGTASTICYENELAWIGMLLVHPKFRGRGIGRTLLERCLEHLRARRIKCIKLDATPEGKPLYEHLGFQSEWGLTRWEIGHWLAHAAARSRRVRRYAESDALSISKLDRQAFGVHRQRFFECLVEDCCESLVAGSKKTVTGYGLLRPGARAWYLGPLVAPSSQTASILVNALLARLHGQPIYWDIPDPNVQARALARSLGFTAQRPLLRMFLGENASPGDPGRYFGIADPATG